MKINELSKLSKYLVSICQFAGTEIYILKFNIKGNLKVLDEDYCTERRHPDICPYRVLLPTPPMTLNLSPCWMSITVKTVVQFVRTLHF